MSPTALLAETSLDGDWRSLFCIVLVAAAIPLMVGLLNIRVAEVVFLIVGGIILGPEVLRLATLTEAITLMSELGLGFLFFFAGYELDRAVLRGQTGRLALVGWVVSVGLSIVAVTLLFSGGIIQDSLGVAIALTSTALGTLLPTIRDSGRLDTVFGRNFMAAGAIGEFGPIVAISVLLGSRSSWLAFLVLVTFLALAVAVAILPRRFLNPRVLSIIERGHSTSSQTAVRIVVVLLVGLLTLASTFELDIVLGAFAAGIIVRLYVPHGSVSPIGSKIEAVAFGLFIPLFFVVTGVKLDVVSIIENPARLLLFFVLLLLVRGLPQMLVYRKSIPNRSERAELSLSIATALPIIVAVTTVQMEAGVMLPANGAALVGAGALSVLVFPIIAQKFGAKARSGLGAADADAVQGDAGRDASVE